MQSIDATAGGAFGPVETGRLGGARLTAGGAGSSAILREGSASGRVLCHLAAVTGSSDHAMFPGPIQYRGAVHVTVTGTPANITLFQA